jgi:DNA-binding transcriptional ArsR family regulator
MGKTQRIPVEAIQAMKKILDALPDKNLDKTKEEALVMLNSQIQRAYSKGYSVKELAAILSEGKVAVSAPTLRAHTY